MEKIEERCMNRIQTVRLISTNTTSNVNTMSPTQLTKCKHSVTFACVAVAVVAACVVGIGARVPLHVERQSAESRKIRKRWTLFRAVVRELEARPQEDDYGIEIVTDAGTSSVSDLGIAGFELVWGWRRLR